LRKVVVVVGLPGAGKSTVLSIASEKLRERGYAVRVVNFGDFMLSYLLQRGVVRSRDEIRKLPLATQRELQESAARAIREELERTPGERFVGIVDTHAVIRTPVGIWPGLPLNVLRELRPDLIAVIEASPEEILSRQSRDSSRVRSDYSSRQLLEELLNTYRYYAIASSVISGAVLAIIANRENQAAQAAEELVRAIEEL
jgi:adenylate kinase